MSPYIYLKEEEVNSIVAKKANSIEFSKGFAYSQDSNTVFHVHCKAPKIIPSGQALDCFFKYNNTDSIETDSASYIEKYLGLSNAKKKIRQAIIIFLTIKDGKVKSKAFFYNSQDLIECVVKYIPSKAELYSRSKGLIETDILKNKKVAIIGVGSGGSFVAVELAKSGVGNFVLFDFDRLELSNISRHVCGINDLGRFKTFAVRDHILQKNPAAIIKTHEVNINDDLEFFSNSIKNVDLIICASDTNASRFNINQAALTNKTVALFGRALTRAAGGDVLRVRPFTGPCLNCLFSTGLITKEEEISQMRQARSEMPAYVNDAEIAQMIQVGLSSDIVPIANMITKLALVELSKGSESGISSLEEDLVADFYIWANRRERVYSQWPKMEYGFNKQTILRWYGAKVSRNQDCIVCGTKNVTGDNIFAESK